jgi:hypothetical protein
MCAVFEKNENTNDCIPLYVSSCIILDQKKSMDNHSHIINLIIELKTVAKELQKYGLDSTSTMESEVYNMVQNTNPDSGVLDVKKKYDRYRQILACLDFYNQNP